MGELLSGAGIRPGPFFYTTTVVYIFIHALKSPRHFTRPLALDTL